MCGIVGFIGKGDQGVLERMTQTLVYRGPDECGYYEDADHPVYLGHRRLIIRDKVGGCQPMTTPDGLLTITYNGEIYNADELRHTLEEKGHVFHSSHSDTEVILYAYREWEEQCVHYFNGMWAFAIFDKARKRLFLSRDRFGKKPLYYTLQNGIFAFASEVKAFRRHPSLSLELSIKSQQKYHAHGYLPGNLSLYRKVYKLPGGYTLVFHLDGGSFDVDRYWTYTIEPDDVKSEAYWVQNLRALLPQSVHRRLVSDVPVGVFLSGGLDSTAVAAFAKQKMQPDLFCSFSVGFEDQTFDETEFAKKASEYLGSHHSVVIFSHLQFSEIAEDILSRLDEPLSDSSLFSYYLLCRHARETVTVALGGDAGDELFAGYDTYRAIRFAQLLSLMLLKPCHPAIRYLISRLPVSHSYMAMGFKLERFAKMLGYPCSLWNPLWLGPLSAQEISCLTGQSVRPEDLYSEAIELWDQSDHRNLLDKALEFYGKIFLQDQILLKVDRMSMLNSLEVRSPLLDIDLINCVRKIPCRFKLRGHHAKYIFKKAMEPFLPHDIIWRKKIGFSAPLGQWFLNQQIRFREDSCWRTEARHMIEKYLSLHVSRKADHRLFLWNTYLMGEWMHHQAPDVSKHSWNNHLLKTS